MKRVIIWIDSKNDKLDQVMMKIRKSLNSFKVNYSIVDISELRDMGEDK